MDVPRSSFRSTAGLAALAALVVAIGIAFAPLFHADFCDFDDHENLVNSAHWRGFTAENLRWMFTQPHMGHFTPLTWLTFAFDFTFWGAEPGALHIVNVVWHAAGALFAAGVARRIARACAPGITAERELCVAVLAAALFALHPLRVESVGWLTERRDVVSGAFWFAALLAWCRYVQDGRQRRDYVLAFALLALSLAAKAWGITFFALLVVLDVWVFGRRRGARATPWRTLAFEKLPFAALCAVFAVLALWAQASAGSTLRSLAHHGVLERVAQAAYGAVFYPLKTLWPAELRVVYALPEPFVATEPRFVAATCVAIAITLVALWASRKSPRAAALGGAWLAFLVVLAPVSGLSQAGLQLVAERYTYLACAPFAIAGALLFACLPRNWPWIAGAAVCTVLAVRTHAQSHTWRTSEALWQNVLALEPDNAHARVNLAQLRIGEAQSSTDSARAQVLYGDALALLAGAGPHAALPQVELNQGIVHARLADLDNARASEHLAESLRFANLGIAAAEAAGQFRASWYHGRAATLFRLERFDEARADLERCARAEPGTFEFRRALALAYVRLGRHADALVEWRAATALLPNEPGVLVRLARSAKATGAAEEARSAYARAVELASRGALLPPAELDEARAGH